MTERERFLLKQGIVQLVDNACTAYKMVNCKPARDEINKYIDELVSLKNKIEMNEI